MPDRSHTVRSFRFRMLWAGQTVSVLGDGTAALAVPLLVLRATGSPVMTALAVASQTVAYLGIGLVAGPLVDRWDIRRVMIVSDAIRVAAFALMAMLAALGAGGWPILATSVIAAGCGVFFETALAVAVQDSLHPGEFVSANAKLEFSNQTGLLLSPALIGVAIATIGIENCLLLNAATFAVSVATILPLRFATPHTATGSADSGVFRQFLVDARSGMNFIRSHRLVANITALQTVINFVVAAETLIIVYADLQMRATPVWIGLILSAAGVGGVCAAVVARRVARRIAPERLIAWSVIGLGGTLLGMALARDPLQLAVVNALHGGLSVFATINIRAVRQAAVPREMLGRVTANARTLAVAANPAGAVLFGLLMGAAGNNARWSFLLAALVSVGSALVARRGLLRHPRTGPTRTGPTRTGPTPTGPLPR